MKLQLSTKLFSGCVTDETEVPYARHISTSLYTPHYTSYCGCPYLHTCHDDCTPVIYNETAFYIDYLSALKESRSSILVSDL